MNVIFTLVAASSGGAEEQTVKLDVVPRLREAVAFAHIPGVEFVVRSVVHHPTGATDGEGQPFVHVTAMKESFGGGSEPP